MAAYGTFVQKTHALKRFQKQIVNQEAFKEKGLAFLMRTCLSQKPTFPFFDAFHIHKKHRLYGSHLFFRLIKCIVLLYVAKLQGCMYEGFALNRTKKKTLTNFLQTFDELKCFAPVLSIILQEQSFKGNLKKT